LCKIYGAFLAENEEKNKPFCMICRKMQKDLSKFIEKNVFFEFLAVKKQEMQAIYP